MAAGPGGNGEMKPRDFLKQLDEARVVAAIGQAEQGTSGEIRVFVSRREVAGDVVARAEERFAKLGLARTAQRNGVLLYFAPRSQKFAIVGDLGIHEKCGPQFWSEVVESMRPHLAQGQFTEAVVLGVGKAGEVLARHFQVQPGDRNELPDQILGDER